MDRQNLGMSFRTWRAGVNVQFTEISAEPLVGFHIQRLIAKEQDLMLRQRLVEASLAGRYDIHLGVGLGLALLGLVLFPLALRGGAD